MGARKNSGAVFSTPPPFQVSRIVSAGRSLSEPRRRPRPGGRWRLSTQFTVTVAIQVQLQVACIVGHTSTVTWNPCRLSIKTYTAGAGRVTVAASHVPLAVRWPLAPITTRRSLSRGHPRCCHRPDFFLSGGGGTTSSGAACSLSSSTGSVAASFETVTACAEHCRACALHCASAAMARARAAAAACLRSDRARGLASDGLEDLFDERALRAQLCAVRAQQRRDCAAK